MANTNRYSTTRIAFIGVMAAIIVVVTFFRFPLLGSKVHFAKAMCLLAGLLLGPVGGGLAAGIGSFLYDILFGGYDVVQGCITFVSKFSMAWICAMLALYHQTGPKPLRVILASVAGALAYVVLYMLKTFVYQAFVYGYPLDAVWLTMLSKLPASLLNAVAAMVATPILFFALHPILHRLQPQQIV